MIIKTADELRELIRESLLAAGADDRNADTVAEHLVLANLSGVDTHGVCQLPGYVEGAKAGLIVPTAWPTIQSETPSSALVSGNWTFGHVAAKYSMEIGIRKGKEHGVAVIALVQANHVGRLGHYVEMAAAEGMISMIWAGGFGEEEPAAVPYGGRVRVLHTNPIAMGFPAGDKPAMMFDYATTAVSGVKVLNASRRDESLPPGCIVDRDGAPSTDPNDFFSGGAAVPFGGHKGYALMMAAEFLGRIFSGSDAYAEPNRAGPIMRHQGVTMIVLRADLFRPFEEYARTAEDMGSRVRNTPPAPGFEEVLVPGDPEVKTRATRERDGIPIADDVWQTICDLAETRSTTDADPATGRR